MVSPAEVRQLFRQFLRAGRNFNSYNVREYILRRAKLGFHENKSSPNADALVEQAKQDLAVVQRQALVYSLYGRGQKSILELIREGEEATQPAQ